MADFISAATSSPSGMPWWNWWKVSRPGATYVSHQFQLCSQTAASAGGARGMMDWRVKKKKGVVVGFLMCLVLTYEGCIVLDAVMHVEVLEVEAPGVVGAIEDPGEVARGVEADRGTKVVRRADLRG